MESIDKFGRVPEETKNSIDDDCEDEEGWDENARLNITP